MYQEVVKSHKVFRNQAWKLLAIDERVWNGPKPDLDQLFNGEILNFLSRIIFSINGRP